MKGPGLGMDERTASVVQRVSAVLYYVTIAALGIDLLARQFVYGLPVSGYEDIAAIYTASVLTFLGAVFYSGAVPIPRIRPAQLAGLYAVAVALGTAFTAFKYGTTAPGEILVHMRVVASVLGVMVVVYALLAYLGNRRIERRISR